MGGINTKEDVIIKLKKLDQKELELNLKLRDLQLKLNQMVPVEERLRVNEYLGKNKKEIRNMIKQKKKKNKKKKKKKHKSKKVEEYEEEEQEPEEEYEIEEQEPEEEEEDY